MKMNILTTFLCITLVFAGRKQRSKNQFGIEPDNLTEISKKLEVVQIPQVT